MWYRSGAAVQWQLRSGSGCQPGVCCMRHLLCNGQASRSVLCISGISCSRGTVWNRNPAPQDFSSEEYDLVAPIEVFAVLVRITLTSRLFADFVHPHSAHRKFGRLTPLWGRLEGFDATGYMYPYHCPKTGMPPCPEEKV